MPKLRLYLDTSVINHLFHDDTPERRSTTEEFFHNAVAPRLYEVFISSIVIDEIQKTPDPGHRQELMGVVAQYDIPLLPTGDDEIDRLAMLYIERGIIPAKKPEDALHVAVAVLHEIDMLISWNFRHLANVRKENAIQSANFAEGYTKPLRIITPLEVAAP